MNSIMKAFFADKNIASSKFKSNLLIQNVLIEAGASITNIKVIPLPFFPTYLTKTSRLGSKGTPLSSIAFFNPASACVQASKVIIPVDL